MARRLDNAVYREARKASGSAERVREFIAAGADVNRRHEFGNTPLWQACYHGHREMVLDLLAAGADPRVYGHDGSGPLYWAASQGHLAVVEILLAHGADPNALRDSNLSPLAAAIYKGHADVVRVLVEAGAAIDHRYGGRTMPEYAEWRQETKIAAELKQFSRTRNWHAARKS